VTNAWLTMALWPVRPLGRQGGEVDRGSKGAKGEIGTANGSPFSRDAPCPGCCNDFKDASKAAPLLSPTYPGLLAGAPLDCTGYPWASLQP
jgi:hypothetical protein